MSTMYPHVSIFQDRVTQNTYSKAYYRAPYYVETDRLDDDVGHEDLDEGNICYPRVARLHFAGFSAWGPHWSSPHGDAVSPRSRAVAAETIDGLLRLAYTRSSRKARVMRLFVDDFLGDQGAEKTLAKLLTT